MRRFDRLLVTACLALLALAALCACSSGPGNFTARGGETSCVDTTIISDGTQVVVVDSSNHVIGTTDLTEDNSTSALNAVKAYDAIQSQLSIFSQQTNSGMSVYKFAVSVPGGLPRYGIQIGGTNHGTVWLSQAQMEAGPQLSIGC